MPWERPAEFPVGRVWSRFKGKDRDGVPGLMYQIRDMDDSHKERCLNLMQENFLRDEPLCRVLDLKKDSESIETLRKSWKELMAKKLSIACFTEENGEPKDLVGFNIVIVKCADDEEEDIDNVKGEEWRKILKTLITTEKVVDIFSLYNVDKYLTSCGLVVLPGHRGQNIGARIIDVRENICKTFGLKVASTIFTAITSQVLAAKCGYEVVATLPYSEMLKLGVDLTGCESSDAKVMARTYT